MILHKLRAICDLLLEHEEDLCGADWVEAQHDVIYLPLYREDVSYADQLRELGCHYADDCWQVYT